MQSWHLDSHWQWGLLEGNIILQSGDDNNNFIQVIQPWTRDMSLCGLFMKVVSETNIMCEVRQSSPEYWEGYKHRKSLWRLPGIVHTWKTTMEQLDNPEPHCIPKTIHPSIYLSIHFLPQLLSCWSLFQVEHKTNRKKFFNATMVPSLFRALSSNWK